MKSIGQLTVDDSGLAVSDDATEAGEMKLVERNGVLVCTLECDEPLSDLATEWLREPVEHDRELRMRELMKQSGVKGFD